MLQQDFILQNYSLCTFSGKSPDATDTDISPSSGSCRNIKKFKHKLLHTDLFHIKDKKKKKEAVNKKSYSSPGGVP